MGKEEPTNDIGSFLYYLDPIDDGRTRLIIRMRDKYQWLNAPVIAMQLAVDVGDIFFQWKHLLGVKARAERMARQEASPVRLDAQTGLTEPREHEAVPAGEGQSA
jgi:hypothetical protein